MGNGKAAKGLWAAGECGCVSVHGANRLGSNSLSQCLVWGKITGGEVAAAHGNRDRGLDSYARAEADAEEKRIEKLLSRKKGTNPYKLQKILQDTMGKYAYVFRKVSGLNVAAAKIKALSREFASVAVEDKSKVYNTNLVDTLEISNLIDLAYVALRCASRRKESRGAHSMVEYPKRDDKNWLKHTIAYRASGGEPGIHYIPVRITRWKPAERKY